MSAKSVAAYFNAVTQSVLGATEKFAKETRQFIPQSRNFEARIPKTILKTLWH
jgi:hypothetical protein